MVKNGSLRGLALWIAALLLGGCATGRPSHTGRVGLLDHPRGREVLSHSRPLPPQSLSSSRPEARVKATEVKDVRSLEPVRIASARRRAAHWASPLREVQVTSHFGRRGGEFHEGVDFRARTGTPVFAVDSGQVLYADSRIGGYGRMIVIRHPYGLATIYGHNSRLLVHRGQRVRRGQRIALSGQTGRSTGPHVHFEVRDGVLALDPLQVLPERRRSRLALSEGGGAASRPRAPLARRD